jgi:hypothetical protein
VMLRRVAIPFVVAIINIVTVLDILVSNAWQGSVLQTARL